MCIICIQLDHGKFLTYEETERALVELINTEEVTQEHAMEVLEQVQRNGQNEVAETIQNRVNEIKRVSTSDSIQWRGFDDEIL